jgi:hypothetical protein
MNTYSTYFCRKCPVNGQTICYNLAISTGGQTILVEDIQGAIRDLPPEGYHEDIAELLTRDLPGQQTLSAHHHGVDIKTVRGEL